MEATLNSRHNRIYDEIRTFQINQENNREHFNHKIETQKSGNMLRRSRNLLGTQKPNISRPVTSNQTINNNNFSNSKPLSPRKTPTRTIIINHKPNSIENLLKSRSSSNFRNYTTHSINQQSKKIYI